MATVIKERQAPADETKQVDCSKCTSTIEIDASDIQGRNNGLEDQRDPTPITSRWLVWCCPVCKHENTINDPPEKRVIR